MTLTTMEYPGSRLTKPWRQLILALFIAAFFITSPLIILYTAGYRFDIAFGLVREVGIITIDGLPRKMQVEINHLVQKNHLPAAFNAILPGEYHLTLSAPGFHDWEQNIVVRAKETTYIKDVDLPRRAIPEQLSSATPEIVRIIPSLGSVIYTEKFATGTRMTYQSLANNETWFTSTTNDEIITITPSPHDEYVALFFSSSTPRFFNTKSLTTFSLPPSSTLAHVYWDPEGKDSQLYTQTTNTLQTINLANGSVTNISTLRDKNNQWRPYKGLLWTFTTTTASSSPLSIEHEAPGLVFDEKTEWNKALHSWAEGPLWHLITITNGTVLLQRNAAKEIALISPKKISTLPVHAYTCETSLRTCVFFGSSEVWNLSEDEDPALVYRSSEPLTAASVMNATDLYLIANAHRLFSYQNFYGITTDLATDVIVHEAYTFPELRIIIFSGSYKQQPGLWKLSY